MHKTCENKSRKIFAVACLFSVAPIFICLTILFIFVSSGTKATLESGAYAAIFVFILWFFSVTTMLIYACIRGVENKKTNIIRVLSIFLFGVFFCAASSLYIDRLIRRINVKIENLLGVNVSVHVFGGGFESSYKTLLPGEVATLSVYPDNGGSVFMEFYSKTIICSTLLDGYTENGEKVIEVHITNTKEVLVVSEVRKTKQSRVSLFSCKPLAG